VAFERVRWVCHTLWAERIADGGSVSRYSEGDGEEWPNAGALWAANVERALGGKKGQAALRELREALMALPQKRLIARAMCTVGSDARLRAAQEAMGWTVEGERAEQAKAWREQEMAELRELMEEQGEGVCAVGAYIWLKNVKAGMSNDEAFAALPTLDDLDHDLEETAWEGKKVGLASTLAWELAFRNDEHYDHLNPEARYVAFMSWIEKQLVAA